MIEDLDTLYEGKATIIKGKQYYSAKAYVEPFVNKLKDYTQDFVCNVKVADQLSVDETEVDSVYNRVLIMAKFPDEYNFTIKFDSTDRKFTRVVCMAYSLDVKRPTCKFYTGVIDDNSIFYAFGGDCIDVQAIEPETPIVYSAIDKVIINGLKDNCKAMLTQFPNITIDKANIYTETGQWVDDVLRKEYINDSGKIKLPATAAVDAYKALFLERDSDCYINSQVIPLLNIYYAWASKIANDDKDFINRYEKTQLINQILNL